VTRKEKEGESRHSSPVTRHFLGLPHGPPFVFVKKLIACEPGVSAECETQFSRDDPMFAGHFPDDPLVPGVILTEALAQTAGITAASAHPENSRPRFLLSAIRQMKFFRAVRPEEKIVLRARKVAAAGELLQFEVEALIDNELAAAGQIVLNALPSPR
jgi:3-hydroxyacyl-[acyl-carrier-protein] dehydratase